MIFGLTRLSIAASYTLPPSPPGNDHAEVTCQATRLAAARKSPRQPGLGAYPQPPTPSGDWSVCNALLRRMRSDDPLPRQSGYQCPVRP
jgi:hypothetical protein